VVVKRGIDTLRRFSDAREDKIGALIGNSESVQVHVNCRKEYTRRVPVTTTDEGELPVKRSARSSLPNFDFKRQCLFCEKDICTTDEVRHPDRQTFYSVVATLHVIESVRSMALRRSDECGEKY